jgi:hypothetical protein
MSNHAAFVSQHSILKRASEILELGEAAKDECADKGQWQFAQLIKMGWGSSLKTQSYEMDKHGCGSCDTKNDYAGKASSKLLDWTRPSHN